MNIDIRDVRLFDYDSQRSHFAQYVRGFEKSPVITGLGPAEIYYLNLSNKEFYNPNEIMNNHVGQYLERCAKTKSPCAPREVEVKQDKISLEWTYTVSDEGFTGTGNGNTKTAAKQWAYKELFINRFGVEAISNALVEQSRVHKHSIRYTINSHDNNTLHNISIATDNNMVLTPTYKGHIGEVESYMSEYFAYHHHDAMFTSITDFLADRLTISNSSTDSESFSDSDSSDQEEASRSYGQCSPIPWYFQNAVHRFTNGAMKRHGELAQKLARETRDCKIYAYIYNDSRVELDKRDRFLKDVKPLNISGIRCLGNGRDVYLYGHLEDDLPRAYVLKRYRPKLLADSLGYYIRSNNFTESSTGYKDLDKLLESEGEPFSGYTDPNIEDDHA